VSKGIPDGGALERIKELDHAHRARLRTGPALTLSLRFLRAAFHHLRGETEEARPMLVSHPPRGVVALTFVGHATVMLTTPKTRLLTDPLLENFLFGLRRAKAPGVAAEDLEDVDLILISHAHHDHLCRKSLRKLSRTAAVVVPPRCRSLVAGLGFAEVVELGPDEVFTSADVEVTAVPVRHSGVRGLGNYRRRGATGFVVRSQGTSVYFAGDTGYFSGFEEIGRRFHPEVALLPIGGYEPAPLRDQHMSPLDAVYAFEDLGSQLFIPITHGSFPLSYEPLSAPLDWLKAICQERNLGDKIAPLDHGETRLFLKP
jgi:L-ascorbate metabolism protein UlaG (beta-lactamase superfamily)